MSYSRQQANINSNASNADTSPSEDGERGKDSSVYPGDKIATNEEPIHDYGGSTSSAVGSSSGTAHRATIFRGGFWDNAYRRSSATVKAPTTPPKSVGNVVASQRPTTTALTLHMREVCLDEQPVVVRSGEDSKQIVIRFYNVEAPKTYINILGEESIRAQLRSIVERFGMPYFKDITDRFGGNITELALVHYGGGSHWTQIKLVVGHGSRVIVEMGFSPSGKFEFGLCQGYGRYSTAYHTPIPSAPNNLRYSGLVVNWHLPVGFNPKIRSLSVRAPEAGSATGGATCREKTWGHTIINGRNVERGYLQQTAYHGYASPELDLGFHRETMGTRVREARFMGAPRSRAMADKYYERFLNVEQAMRARQIRESTQPFNQYGSEDEQDWWVDAMVREWLQWAESYIGAVLKVLIA